GWADRVDVVTGGWADQDADRTAPQGVLVRPDGHIVWAAPDGGDLAEALTRWFGHPAA
ncbi:hypothetical protein G3I25_16770, partial [Streptomyces rochei]|nr:hypothetical protein [Streptomyces rochei]